MAIGGMPKVVANWRDSKDIKTCQELLHDITTSYERDFPKYAKNHQIKYVDLLFKQLPRHITKRFKYSILNTAFKKRELEPALHLLQKARIIKLVYHSHGNGIPLGAEHDVGKFKIILFQ